MKPVAQNLTSCGKLADKENKKERKFIKPCFYVYSYWAYFLWIDRYTPLFTLCTAIQKSVVMCRWGVGITVLSLWIKVLLVHRRVYLQLSPPVINRAKGWLYTGLNSEKIADSCLATSRLSGVMIPRWVYQVPTATRRRSIFERLSLCGRGYT